MKNLILLFLVLFTASSFSQTEDLDSKWPRLKEGRMFTLKLVPAGQRLEVQVTGKDVAAIDLKDISITAKARSGQESWDVEVSREGEKFVLPYPLSEKDVPQLDLKLKVMRKKQAEEFHFPSLPAPR